MDDFRKTQPLVFNIDTPVIPAEMSVKLDNGIPVFLIESGTEDIMRMDFTFRAGQINEYFSVLALATNLMLKEGSEKYSSVELNRLIDYHGSFINLYIEKDLAGLKVYLLNKHAARIMELSREMLFKPVFPEEELSTLMNKQLRWFQIRKQKVMNLAMDQFFESVFGDNHPYGKKPSEGDFERINNVLVKDFHSKYYTPGNMAIIVTGKIPARIDSLLNSYFGDITLDNYTQGSTVKINGNKEKRVHVPYDNAVQNCIKIGSTTINKNNPEYQGLKIADTVLGGYFGSKLMKNIREDKGYTYGISSYVTSLEASGYKVISTEVGVENTQKTIDEILKEINLLQTVPVDPSELATAKNYMMGELIRMFDGPFASADSFKSVWEFGLDTDYYLRFFEKIKSITPEEIMAIASKYFKIDDLYTITAGAL